MISNYFKIAIRNILRQKGYSLINIFGLAIGLTCALLILLWVQDELSYDKFWEQSANIYRVEQDQNYSGRLYHVNVTQWPAAPIWKDEIPEILQATRYGWSGGQSYRNGDIAFIEQDVRAIDPDFFTIFDFTFKYGNPENAMDDPNSIVLNEETAIKYFGDMNPIGEVLTVNGNYGLTVTGVLDDPPANSVVQPKMLVSIETAKKEGNYIDSWGTNSIGTFVLAQPNSDLNEVNRKLTEVVNNNRDEESLTQYMVNPITSIHLYEYFGYDSSNKLIVFVYLFSIIAGFILLIACINFMNLATARSARRAREIGIRKVVGSNRSSLIMQFISESTVIAVLALFVALLFVLLLLPGFNQIAVKEIGVSALLSANFILGMIAITIITGLVSGSYPAFFLSAFRPIKVLKGELSTGRSQNLRKILVTFQFTLTILLIISTITVYKQLKFMQNKDLGFNYENVVSVNIRGSIRDSYAALKSEMTQLPQVLGVTASSHRPTNIGSNSGGANWDGKDPDYQLIVGASSIDFDYVETLGIELVEGRSFSKEFPSDISDDDHNAYIINETLKEIMGKESVVNENLSFLGGEGPIVGVMKDFHFRSIHNEIEPLAVLLHPEWFSNMLIKLAPGVQTNNIQVVEKVWNKILPDYPFEYQLLEEDFESMYRIEMGAGKLLQYLTILVIIIASLGLLGLSSFTAEQRTKELGVRKVLGASIANLVVMMIYQFTKWVFIAIAIAFPIAYYLLNKYLENYAYRIDLSLGIFVLSGLLAIVVAVLTVSYQAAKAAMVNPAKTLKYE